MESDVNYRGQQIIRNKEGKRINSARWTLTPAKPSEQPDAQQNCKIVKAAAATVLEASSDLTEETNDERVLRCSRGKNARHTTGQQFTLNNSLNFSQNIQTEYHYHNWNPHITHVFE